MSNDQPNFQINYLVDGKVVRGCDMRVDLSKPMPEILSRVITPALATVLAGIKDYKAE